MTETVPLRADALANRDRVLEAAAEAFARDGSDASLRSVARDAGVGIATLYRRFPSRELLVEAVYRNESQRLCDAGVLLLDEHPPAEALSAWMGQFLGYLATKSGMAETLRALLTTDDALRLQTRARLIDTCGQLLRAAADAGEVRAGVDPEEVVLALGGFAFIAEEQGRPDLHDRLLALLLDGIRESSLPVDRSTTVTTELSATDEPRVRRPRRWRRRLLVLAFLLALGSLVLTQLDTQVSTAVGADGVGRGSFPVVEVAGLGSKGAGFAQLTKSLQAKGTMVLDFDPDTAGVQPLVYQPPSGARIPDVAVDIVQPAIRAALSRVGLDPDTQMIDVVAHSMGGLAVRYLIEHPVGHWARQVDDLVMVATPNHGSDVIAWETGVGGGNHFAGLGQDMKPGSPFLRALGTREPAGEVYTTIGGDPWMFRWLRYGSHGFDDQVPAESPFLTGAAHDTFPHLHGKLLKADAVVRLITRTLAAH